MRTRLNPSPRPVALGALAFAVSFGALTGCDMAETAAPVTPDEIVRLPDTFDREGTVAKAEAAAQVLAGVAAQATAAGELAALVEATHGPHDEAVRFVHLLRPDDPQARRTLGVTDPSVVVEDRGAFADAFRSSFEAVQASNARTAPDVTLGELEAFLIENDMQVYWPNYERWDGETAPVVTFDPMNDQTENVAYRVAGDNARAGTLMVDEAYAQDNPTWVVNVSEMPDSDVIVLEPGDGGGGGWGGGGGGTGSGGPTCPGPPSAEPQNDATLVKLGWYKAEKNFDSWFNGGSEMRFTHPKGEVNLADPNQSKAVVTSFQYFVGRSQVGKWLNFDHEYISNWTKEIRNQKLMIHEQDVQGPFTFKGSVGFSIPIPGLPMGTANPSIGFEKQFKTTEPVIYLRDTDRASYFLFNRDGAVESGTGLRDCFRVYKGGQDVMFTLPVILRDY